ncbi:MAG: AMP phosphotransferase [Proteobacteria bacterium]|nr:AMP phosphotransferase [Pseudomonadota bacterium]
MGQKKAKKEYDQRLKQLQEELPLIQQAFSREGQRGVVVFEGWDAAGKGGVIRRISWAMDPRTLRVWPIAAPDCREKKEHWLQRFWTRLPEEGAIAVFDRSWYGRVLVERVEGFASEKEWFRAYEEIRQFEQTLYEDGVKIIKFQLDITPQTQLERFKARLDDPTKRFKLTLEDFRNRAKWKDYEQANRDMVEQTHCEKAPWYVIDANNKKKARIKILEYLVQHFKTGLSLELPERKPELELALSKELASS